MTVLDEALALAALEIPVFPLRVTDKRPVVEGGFKSASTDPDTVARMFADPAAGLIGVPTGPPSGIDALDIDPGKGGLESASRQRVPNSCDQAPSYAQRRDSLPFHARGRPAELGEQDSTGSRYPRRRRIYRLVAGSRIARRRHHGGVSRDQVATWPDWLLVEGMRRQHREGTAPPAAELAPPSATALLAVLAAMDNPAAVTRDEYTTLNLAVQGCLRALDALGKLDPNDAEDIRHAAAEWSAKWEGEHGGR